jgi:hypothetical protein
MVLQAHQSLNSKVPSLTRRDDLMAHPIEIGLVLEGEDALEFIEDLRNPKKPTKEQMEMFREAVKIYKEHPF